MTICLIDISFHQHHYVNFICFLNMLKYTGKKYDKKY